jgi:hypothetical protein
MTGHARSALFASSKCHAAMQGLQQNQRKWLLAAIAPVGMAEHVPGVVPADTRASSHYRPARRKQGPGGIRAVADLFLKG